MDIWIDGRSIFITLAGWWSVFHQSTENLITGSTAEPTRASTAELFSPLVGFSKALARAIKPTYIKNNTSTDVSRASQTHHVPHIGFPHNEPVTRHTRVKHAPTGAAATAEIWAMGCFQINPVALAITMKAYANIAIQAAGTWTYIILTV